MKLTKKQFSKVISDLKKYGLDDDMQDFQDCIDDLYEDGLDDLQPLHDMQNYSLNLKHADFSYQPTKYAAKYLTKVMLSYVKDVRNDLKKKNIDDLEAQEDYFDNYTDYGWVQQLAPEFGLNSLNYVY